MLAGSKLVADSRTSFELASVMEFGFKLAYLNKNSSGDEIANVNFFLQHRTCKGQRLRPLNEFVISTKHTIPTYPSNRLLKWTRPSNPLRTTNGRAHC